MTVKHLDFMIGTWNIQSFDYIDGQWQAGEKNTADITPILEGASLQEFIYIKGPKYHLEMTTILTYDPFGKEFQVASIDKKFSYIDVFNGQLDEQTQTLRVDNIKRGIPITINNQPTVFQLSWTRTDGGMEFLVQSSTDQGGTWNDESKIIYTR